MSGRLVFIIIINVPAEIEFFGGAPNDTFRRERMSLFLTVDRTINPGVARICRGNSMSLNVHQLSMNRPYVDR